MIVLNIENINRLFFCLLEAAFKIHLAQKSEGARVPSLSMGMTPLVGLDFSYFGFDWIIKKLHYYYFLPYESGYISRIVRGGHFDKKMTKESIRITCTEHTAYVDISP